MRGHMDAGEYKHVALGLIFLKYISDAFQERYDAIKKEPNEPEDRDKYMGHNVFWVPPEARWGLKCTSVKALRGDHVVCPLKLKNYDDLRLDDPIVPRMLVVVLVPGDESQWLRQTEEELCLRRCAYWRCLRGMGESRVLAKVAIRLPRQNLFSVEGLQALMSRAGRREPL